MSPFGAATARAMDGAAQNKPACPIVLRNARRVGELTYIDISVSASGHNFISTESEHEQTESTEFTKWLAPSGCLSFFLTGFNSVNFVHSVFMELEGIDHVAMSVRDVFIGKGTTSLALFPTKSDERSTSLAAVASAKAASGRDNVHMLHLALRANRRNFLAAQEELKRRDIKFEFQDHEISHSIYFQDPDGHRLEITTYELE